MTTFPIPNILSVLTFLPLAGAFALMFCPRPKDIPEDHGHVDGHDDHHTVPNPDQIPPDPARKIVFGIAALFSLLPFVLAVWLFTSFQFNYVDAAAQGLARNMQLIEDLPWITIGSIDIRYKMGVDGISLLLILLTTFLMPLCVAFSGRVKQRLKEFMIFMLLLETGMIGVFCALDLVLFYVFWEAMLIPMYFLIGIFGHENRIYAAIKFFLYTFAGSIFMLVAIIATYQVSGSFDLIELTNQTQGGGWKLANYAQEYPRIAMWLYAAFALAFMIKVPMFPFHTWLPDAHVEAPTAGSVILAGVLLKMGTYGFVRFCIPLFPTQAINSANLFITLAIIGIIYGSIVAAVQTDAKKLVAYSSVAHLGFVVLGIFCFTPLGMMGALIQNINHGISTPMLFFIVGMLYDRRHTREIKEFGGLKLITPMLATMLLLATLSSIAVPFFNGFVGEFTILQGSWISLRGGFWPTALAATGMILSAVYMLWWFQRLMLGPVTRPINRHLPDLTLREWVVLTPLTAIVFWIGLFSHYWTQRMDASVDTLFIPYNQRYQLNTQMPNVDRIERAQMQKARESGQFQGMRSPMSGGRPSQSPTPPSLTTPEGTVPQTDAGAAGTESNTTTPGTPPGETGPPTESPQTPAGETGTPPGNPAGTQPGTTPGNPTGNP